MNWPNKITSLLNIQYPIIQAPMLGITTPQMVAAISDLGGLGSLPVGTLPADKTRELIRKTKSITDKPFAVNIFGHALPHVDPKVVDDMQNYLVQLGSRNGLKLEKLKVEDLKFYSYEDQIDVLIEEKVQAVSFIFALLRDDIIKRLKENNIILIGSATCLKEAKILEEKGIDIIVAQSIEAGGHRSTFLVNDPLPQIGAMSLIPSLADNISKPVIAAGGINDGRTIKAAFILGASGVQIGTAFLASDESLAAPSYKNQLEKANDTDYVLTKSFSGRWARGIRNTLMTELDNSGLPLPEFPIQVSLTGPLKVAAQGNPELAYLWAGQSASKSQKKSCAEIFENLVRQTESL